MRDANSEPKKEKELRAGYPQVVALTGSIGSGKSMVGEEFGRLGAGIIDADVLAREVVVKGSRGLAAVGKAFGPEVLTANGELNRSQLAARIFHNPADRNVLDSILHPLIRELFLLRLKELKRQNPPLIVYIVPLFFESRHTYEEISKVVVVYAHQEQLIERIMKRNNLSRDDATRRILSQLPMDEKVKRADYVIDNSGEPVSTIAQARELYQRLVR
jgi:dephospho-CoA kinase